MNGVLTLTPDNSKGYDHGSSIPIADNSKEYDYGTFIPIADKCKRYDHGSFILMADKCKGYDKSIPFYSFRTQCVGPNADNQMST